MKKILHLLVAAVTAACLFSGCETQTPHSETLTYEQARQSLVVESAEIFHEDGDTLLLRSEEPVKELAARYREVLRSLGYPRRAGKISANDYGSSWFFTGTYGEGRVLSIYVSEDPGVCRGIRITFDKSQAVVRDSESAVLPLEILIPDGSETLRLSESLLVLRSSQDPQELIAFYERAAEENAIGWEMHWADGGVLSCVMTGEGNLNGKASYRYFKIALFAVEDGLTFLYVDWHKICFTGPDPVTPAMPDGFPEACRQAIIPDGAVIDKERDDGTSAYFSFRVGRPLTDTAWLDEAAESLSLTRVQTVIYKEGNRATWLRGVSYIEPVSGAFVSITARQATDDKKAACDVTVGIGWEYYSNNL